MKLTLEGLKSFGSLCRMFSGAIAVLVLATGCGTDGNSGTVPVTAGTTWSITPAGGTFQTNDGRVTLVVPPNAVAANVRVTPQVSSSPGTAPVNYTMADGTFVQFNSVTFVQPVTLRFRIPATVPDAEVPFVRVFRKPDGSNTWQALARVLDIPNRTIEIQTTQFSGFAVFTPGPNDWVIDQPGGDFQGAGTRIGLTVEANAVNSLYAVRHTPIAPSDMGDLPAGWRYVQDSAFDFVWSDPTTQFTPAATYRIRFAGLNIPCDPSLVAIFTRTDFGPTHQWNQNGTTGLNAAVDEATVLVNRLQQHALFCPEPVLPVHTVTKGRFRNGSGQEVSTIEVHRLDGTAFVPVASQSYVRDILGSVELFEGVVLSGVGVSAETLTAATLAMDTASYSTQSLVVLNLNTNQLDTIDSFSTSGAGQAWNQSSPVGISPDGATVAAGVYYYDGGFNTTRRTVRVYSRQSHEFTETDLGATDRSNIEAVGRNGEVLLSDKLRANGTTVTVVRNGSIQMQVSGVMPRLNPEATKMYVVNGGQIEERDLTNGQLRTIPVDPVDYSIQSDAMVHYRQTLNGCELVHFDMRTRQETLLAPSVPCPNESGIQDFSAVFMVR